MRDSADYNVYSAFQSHEAEFDYLKSLEIEEKINQLKWLPRCNQAHFLLSTNGKASVSRYALTFEVDFFTLLSAQT